MTRECACREAYLDRALSPDEGARFEAHLPSCASCSEHVRSWQQIEAGLADWAQAKQIPEPSPFMAERLVRRARERGGPQPRFAVRPWALAGAAAGVAAALSVVVWAGVGDRDDRRGEALAVEVLAADGVSQTIPAARALGAFLAAPESGRLVAQLGRDRVGLSSRSRARVVRADSREIRLRLETGQIAAEVEPGLANRAFVVETDGLSVRVVGTRFAVRHEESGVIEVAVSRGKVRVTGAGGFLEEVSAGNHLRLETGTVTPGPLTQEEAADLDSALADPQPVRPSTEPADEPQAVILEEPDAPQLEELKPPSSVSRRRPVSRETLRRSKDLIVAAHYPEAEAALTEYLRQRPRDAEAWALLGDGRRKVGAYRKAVAAYRQAIETGDPTTANRARLLAATILQEQLRNHADAAALLQDLLRRAPEPRSSDEVSAMVRLAKSELALGHKAECRAVLDEVLRRHPTAAVAVQAKRLLPACE